MSTITDCFLALFTILRNTSRLQVHVVEQRRNQRFALQLPVRVIGDESGSVTQFARTRNISSGGVLLAAETEVPLGRTIEYVITLTNVCGAEVGIRCLGKVVRLENSVSDSPGYLIAATLDRYQFIRRPA